MILNSRGCSLLILKNVSFNFSRSSPGHIHAISDRCWTWRRVLRTLVIYQMEHSKWLNSCREFFIWLEELASREKYYTGTRCMIVRGKTAGQDIRKQCVRLGQLIVHISGLTNSFGIASCVVQENISLLHWIAAGPSRKSKWERLGWDKVSPMMINVIDFIIRGR